MLTYSIKWEKFGTQKTRVSVCLYMTWDIYIRCLCVCGFVHVCVYVCMFYLVYLRVCVCVCVHAYIYWCVFVPMVCLHALVFV